MSISSTKTQVTDFGAVDDDDDDDAVDGGGGGGISDCGETPPMAAMALVIMKITVGQRAAGAGFGMGLTPEASVQNVVPVGEHLDKSATKSATIGRCHW